MLCGLSEYGAGLEPWEENSESLWELSKKTWVLRLQGFQSPGCVFALLPGVSDRSEFTSDSSLCLLLLFSYTPLCRNMVLPHGASPLDCIQLELMRTLVNFTFRNLQSINRLRRWIKLAICPSILRFTLLLEQWQLLKRKQFSGAVTDKTISLCWQLS
jgi:hypothetical protein